MHTNTTFIVLFLATVFCASCSNKKNASSISDGDRFVNFYADYLVIQEESRNLHLDTLTLRKRIDSVYETYHLNRQQVAATMSEYNKDAARWKEFYGKVVKRLETMQSSSQQPQK